MNITVKDEPCKIDKIPQTKTRTDTANEYHRRKILICQKNISQRNNNNNNRR